MTSYEDTRRFGDTDVPVRVVSTGARCPSCHGSVVGGTLPAGSGDMEVETRVMENAQGGKVSWRTAHPEGSA